MGQLVIHFTTYNIATIDATVFTDVFTPTKCVYMNPDVYMDVEKVIQMKGWIKILCRLKMIQTLIPSPCLLYTSPSPRDS